MGRRTSWLAFDGNLDSITLGNCELFTADTGVGASLGSGGALIESGTWLDTFTEYFDSVAGHRSSVVSHATPDFCLPYWISFFDSDYSETD